MLDVTTYQALSDRIADVIDSLSTDADTPVGHIEIGGMADGSGRYYALVTSIDPTNDLEQQFRISTPAPWNSPAWAADFREFTLEVRIGDSWQTMEFEAA
jgi:hypothetical protein